MTPETPAGVALRRAEDPRAEGGMMLHDGVAEVSCSLGSARLEPGLADELEIVHETEELMFVVEGSGVLLTPDETIAFATGDALHIPAGVWHSLDNTGAGALVTVFAFPLPHRPDTRSRRRDARQE